MEAKDYYQSKAREILVRNIRQVQKDGNKPAAWDGWLAQVIFAYQLHVISETDYRSHLRRYAEYQQGRTASSPVDDHD